MPISFDEYTSIPVFFQPDGEPQQSLFHDDNNLLEFGDAIFEATENGWGFYADVQATADASKYPMGRQVRVTLLREPDRYFIGFMYTSLYAQIEISNDIADEFCQDLPLFSLGERAVRLGHALTQAIPSGIGHDVDPLDQETGLMILEFLDTVATSLDHKGVFDTKDGGEVDFGRWARDVLERTRSRMICFGPN